jgi:hypothetical protein
MVRKLFFSDSVALEDKAAVLQRSLTALTSFLIHSTGLAKTARQQKAAIRAKSVGRSQMKLAARMASRRSLSILKTSNLSLV